MIARMEEPKERIKDDRPVTLAMAYLKHSKYGSDLSDWDDEATPKHAATLRYWREDFYVFEACAYRRLVPEELRARVTRFLNTVVIRKRGKQGDDYESPLRVTDTVVSETLKQMRSIAQVFNVDSMPAWIDFAAAGGSDRPPISDVIPFHNGWIDAEAWTHGSQTKPHDATPLWFSTSAIPSNFDPSATCPLFLRAMGQWLRNDAESIGLLQEYVGLCLTGDTSFHKMLWLYGKGGTGKSTFANVLAHLVGPRNTVRFELHDFLERFTYSAWLGKTLAISADAEIGARGPEVRRIVGQIKAITGEDDRLVDRKNKELLDGVRLKTRLILCVNRLPSLPSSGGDLKRRFLIAEFHKINEIDKDKGLIGKLMAETAGIAQWALEGLRRLRLRGKFPVTQTSAEMNDRMAELSSHVPAFIDECCDIQEPTVDGKPPLGDLPHFTVPKNDIYAAYADWCKAKLKGQSPEELNRFCESVYDATDAKPYYPRVGKTEDGRAIRATKMQWIRLKPEVAAGLATRELDGAPPINDVSHQGEQEEINFGEG